MTEARARMSEQGAGRSHLGTGRPHLWAVWAPLCRARSWFDCFRNYASFLIEFLFCDCDVPPPHLFSFIFSYAICGDKHIQKI